MQINSSIVLFLFIVRFEPFLDFLFCGIIKKRDHIHFLESVLDYYKANVFNRMKKNKEDKGLVEFVELLRALIDINKKGVTGIFISLPIALALKWLFNVNIPDGLLILLSIFVLTMVFYLYLLIKKVGSQSDLENVCTGYFITNLLLYTFIIHYIGGTEWVGIFIYFFIIIEANIILSRRRGTLITFLAIIFYSSLAYLEYFGIIPHHEFFLSGPNLYRNPSYLSFIILVGAFFGFNYVGLITSNFSNVYRKISNILRGERKELVKVQSQLEEAKTSLEIRVAARTRELRNLTENLEKDVKTRTQEASEKVEELEKFQKFSIGRELKMVELKQRIRKLEKELEQYQKK